MNTAASRFERVVLAVAVLVAALLAPRGAHCDTPTTTPMPNPEPVRLLDVPFVPQSERLCGGAALAMVLRYWGESSVRAEDFARLAAPGDDGISRDSLATAARGRGCPAFAMRATVADLRDHLGRGRPLIALVDAGSGKRHFVVILAATQDGVILHDPAAGPYRTETFSEFDRRWTATERWALLVLPPEGRAVLTDPSKVALETRRPVSPETTRSGAPAPPPPDTTEFDTPVIPEVAANGPAITGCDAMVAAGVQKSRGGATDEAAGLFQAAATICPGSAAPVRELAGLRFGAKDYDGAAKLAARAIEIDPQDADTWRLLAGSCYAAGDVHGALEAWNHIGEPKSDLIRVDGLRRTRPEVVSDQIDLPPGNLIRWVEYRRAQRRLQDLPAASRARLELQPTTAGAAQVRAAVTERPLLFDGPIDLGIAAGRAAASNEVALHLASPLGLGELWTARYRFKKNRRRGFVTLDVPALLGRPGIWRFEGMVERQTYALQPSVDGPRYREDRRRFAISYGDWISADWRAEVGAGFDRFIGLDGVGGHSHFTYQGEAEARGVGDHIAVVASGAGWVTGGESPFREGDILARYGSDDYASGDWLLRAGATAVSSHAPRALWPGAGTGSGRVPLLRAHPLLDTGILNGVAFGRRLAYGGIERRAFPFEIKPVRIGFAVFLDAAKAWDPLIPRDVPWQFDTGGGVRIRAQGGRTELRVDYGYGLQDHEHAVSVGLTGR